MWIVTQNSNKELKFIRKLSINEKELIKYTNSVKILNKENHQQKFKEALNLLLYLKQRDYWITCDCNESPPTIMTICQRNNVIFLRRLPTTRNHKKSCLFYSEIVINDNFESKRNKIPKNELFSIYKSSEEIAAPVSENKDKKNNSNSTPSLPKLGTCLYRLLDEANLLALKENIDHISTQYERIKKISKNLQIAPNISLSDYFWTHPGQIGFAGISISNSINRWPKTTWPHGFMLLISQEIINNKLKCVYGDKEYIIEVSGKIKKSSGRLGALSAPYLTLLTITKNPLTNFFKPTDAFAIPVYSNHILMPVESSYERIVLKKLIELMFSLKKHQLNLTIKKPLFNIETDSGEYCRPDFIIESHNKKIILEVMGSNEIDYLERKTRTHSIMQNLGELLFFDANLANIKNNWSEALNILAKQIYHFLLK